MAVNLPDLTGKALSLIQGEEKRLRLRQRHARFGIAAAVGGLALQLGIALFGGDKGQAHLGEFLTALWHGRFQELWTPAHAPEIVGAAALFIGLTAYMLLRWTGFLFQESKEPFRYTFHVEDFTLVSNIPAPDRFVLKNADRFNLLSQDLIERLNQRIKRLSILEVDQAAQADDVALGSHIAIKGKYAIREETKGRWIIEVMPQVRIGPTSRPWTVAPPVKYLLITDPKADARDQPGSDVPALTFGLDADGYNRIVERVHSAVATEVYRQIDADVRNKITFFPTDYLRAVALGHEAEDFARSNTVDAYDRSIKLYREALRYFSRANIRPITDRLLRWPGVWRSEVRFAHTEARVITGFAKALIYRRKLSTLTGRNYNPLFEIPPLLERAIGNLRLIYRWVVGFDVTARQDANRGFLTFPRDTWRRSMTLRPSGSLFDRQRAALFEAFVVAALASYYLGSGNQATRYLEDARAVDPQRAQQDALYLMTAAEIEPALDQEIVLFQKAAELQPDFQIACYLYANYSEMLFRARAGELSEERVQRVIDLYDDVLLRINPGNIAALAAQGYLYWLVKKPGARLKFAEGRELKSLVRETYVGILTYGMARIAAEEGCFNESYERYTEALAADSGVAAYSLDASARANGSYYEYITPQMVRRYQEYQDAALAALDKAVAAGTDARGTPCSPRTLAVVRSFVLNDVGNASLNYYIRTGDVEEWQRAVRGYEAALSADPTNAAAYYNLAAAQMLQTSDATDGDSAVAENLTRAESLAPTWPIALTATAKAHMESIRRVIDSKRKERRIVELKLEQARRRVENERKRERVSDLGWQAQFAPWQSSSAPSPGTPLPLPLASAPPATDVLDTLRSRLGRIDAEIADQQERITMEVLPRLDRAFQRTTFGPLIAGSAMEQANIGRLLALSIDRARIDENDIEALKLLAAVLSRNSDTPDEIAATERLCDYLKQYHAEDFDRDLLLYEMYAGAKQNEQQRAATARIQETVRRWLKMDPGHYVALSWVPDSRAGFTLSEGKELLDKAAASQTAEASVYHLIAGDFFYLADQWSDSIREYAALVALTPNNADHANRLANAYVAASQYADAVPWYQTAARLNPNQRTGVYQANLGLALRQLKHWEDAVAAYAAAAAQDPDNPDYKRSQALVLNDWGDEVSAAGQKREAIAKYEAASAADPSFDVSYSNLSKMWADLREPGERAEHFDRAIKYLQEASVRATDTTEYGRRLASLKSGQRIARHYGEQVLERQPGVTPVVLEIAADLVPLVQGTTGGLTETAASLTSQMRNRILVDLGVTVPGILYRSNEIDFPNGHYEVKLHETTVAAGECSVHDRLSPMPVGQIADLGIPFTAASRPDTGAAAALIADAYWSRFPTGQLWEIMEYPIRHLERVLRQNLTTVFGHQDVANLLQGLDTPAAPMILQDPRQLTALTLVLRGLLSEAVSIMQLRPIVDQFADLWQKRATPRDIVEQVRRLPQVRATIARAEPAAVRRPLPPRLESQLQAALRHDDGRAAMNLAPDERRLVLRQLHETIDQPGQTAASLVVKRAELRPYIHELLKVDYPDLPVLASAETPAETLSTGQ